MHDIDCLERLCKEVRAAIIVLSTITGKSNQGCVEKKLCFVRTHSAMLLETHAKDFLEKARTSLTDLTAVTATARYTNVQYKKT